MMRPYGPPPIPLANAVPAHSTAPRLDRKSTRLNSSHSQISYAVFCLKKKKKTQHDNKHLYTTVPSHEPNQHEQPFCHRDIFRLSLIIPHHDSDSPHLSP